MRCFSPKRRHLLSFCAGALLLTPPVSAAGKVVVDMAGRSVRLPGRIERIASAGGSPAVNAFLFLFGQGERIVTGLPVAFQSPLWRFQQLFAPGIAGQPVVSGPPPAWTPNVETLLALRPDVSFVVSETAAQLLERAGLCAIVLKWDALDSIDRTVQLLAGIFDARSRAQAYFAWRQPLLDAVAKKTGPVGYRPRVLYLRYSTLTQPIMVPANHLIAQAGGDSVTARENPLHLDSFPFSVEQILAWQPEVLLLAFGEEKAALLADARLASLPAIRQKRIFSVPHGAHIWTHYTPEQPLGVLWLAKQLFPEAMGEFDLAGETRGFYQRFFGKRLADKDIDALIGERPSP